MAVTMPKRLWSVVSRKRCAVRPPSRLPATVATSSSIPSRKLMSCSPLRPADTELDVAMTVVRLIAAALRRGSPRATLSRGTRNTPPPMPRSAPTLPAAAPDTKMIAASANETTGICSNYPAVGPAPAVFRDLRDDFFLPLGQVLRVCEGFQRFSAVGGDDSQLEVLLSYLQHLDAQQFALAFKPPEHLKMSCRLDLGEASGSGYRVKEKRVSSPATATRAPISSRA